MHRSIVRLFYILMIVGLLAIADPVAYAQENAPRARQESKKKGRVKADEPTVMTVKGKVTPVEDRNLAYKIGHGIRTGVVGTARAAVNLVGWFFDPKNEVPSDRERQEQAAGQNTQQ